MQDQRTATVGYCECGCGGKTTVSTRTDRRRGAVLGEPRRFIRGHGNRRPFAYVIEDRGYITPCWIWRWGKDTDGYGITHVERRAVGAHRASYERHVGPIPAGMHLDHLCRVHACVNPAHLEPVTNAENQRRGIKTKLSAADVLLIRARAERGETQRSIAADYGVTQAQVSNIVRGVQWGGV